MFSLENLPTSIIYIVLPDHISRYRFLMPILIFTIFANYKCHLWFEKFFHVLLHIYIWLILWSHLFPRIIISWIYLKIWICHIFEKISLWRRKSFPFTNGKITCKSRSRTLKIIIMEFRIIQFKISVEIQILLSYIELILYFHSCIFSIVLEAHNELATI